MSQLLVAELTSLSLEARRKHPEIKQAVDALLVRLKADTVATLSASRADPTPALQHPLLKPVLLSCQTKLPKVISLALSLLQRILLQKLAPDHTISTVIDTLNTLVKGGRIDVDVQLKILQIASALLSSYPSIHNNDLAETLMLGFRLQETSKVAVVSSTAAATLRQSVMTVFDKVKEEDAVLDAIKDGGEEAAASAPLAALSVDIPGSQAVTLFPASRDAYLLFSDLCALASGEETRFLSLQSLSKTFSLELIESILTNHPRLFNVVKTASSSSADTAHPELLFLLRSRTCPLLIKSLSEPPAFPIYLRLMRLLFLLLRQFSSDLVLEVEILMTILLRSVFPTPQDIKAHGASPPLLWQQVLALEVIRSLCSNDVFLRSLWEWYDAKQEDESNSIKVFGKLVETLQHALSQGEKIFSIEPSMSPAKDEVPESPQRSRFRQSLDRSFSNSGIYEAAAGVANAAISGVFQTSDHHGAEILSVTSSPTVQIIDQLDKIEPPAPGSPALPKTYPQLLALQSVHFLTQSMAGYALPVYSKFVNARPAGAAPAPPAITDADIQSLKSLSDRTGLITTRDMLRNSAERLSDALMRCLRIKSTDTVFEETLLALRNLINVTGALDQAVQRNVILLRLIPFAVPSFDPDNPSTNQKAEIANLSNRNLACLRALAQVIYYLSGSLGSFWYIVLGALCAAHELLITIDAGVARRTLQAVSETDVAEVDGQTQNRHSATLSTLTHTTSLNSRSGRSQLQLLNSTDLQPAQIEAQIRNIFVNTSSLSDEAFLDFVSCLCKQSQDLLDASNLLPGMQSNPDDASPRTSGFGNTKRKSGTWSKTEALPSFFPISCIGLVADLNIKRLCLLPSTQGWDLILDHLQASILSTRIQNAWRMQATEIANSILFSAIGQDTPQGDFEHRLQIQRQVCSVFANVGTLTDQHNGPTDVLIRTLTVTNLQKVLGTYGHVLLCGWDVFFTVCRATCNAHRSVSQTPAVTKSNINLVKAGFSCLQLICSDYLSLLDRSGIRSCVECLKAFGHQPEDVNVALTSIGCLWGVTAEMASRANAYHAQEDVEELWLFVLQCLLDLAQDPRSDVRNGAISNLHQVLQQYGETLDSAAWVQIADTILFPLVTALNVTVQHLSEAASSQKAADVDSKDREAGLMGYAPSELKQWQESQALALGHLGEVTRDLLVAKLLQTADFQRIWSTILSLSRIAFLQGPATTSQAAIKCLTLSLSADLGAEINSATTKAAWTLAWENWVQIGEAIPAESTCQFTQKNLLAYIQAFSHIYRVIQPDFDAEQSARLLACLKVCTAYTRFSDQASDTDSLTAVQEAARATARSIGIVSGVTPLLLADLASSISLAYTLTADNHSQGTSKPTFVAVSRTSISEAVQLYFDKESDAALYTCGAVESLFDALMVPIQLKYDCPRPSSVHSRQQHRPLWQQATLAFCKITGRCCPTLHTRSEQLGQETVSRVWVKIVDVLEAALLADCTASLDLPTEQRDADERFGLHTLATIETSVLPFLGRSAAPDQLVQRLGAILAQASKLYSTEEEAFGERNGGRSDDIVSIPNERLGYWCFDLLALGCSKSIKDETEEDLSGRRRIAHMFSPYLIKRCEDVLQTYVQDSSIRGMLPMHRIREEEVNYVLNLYLDLKLCSGSLAKTKRSEQSLTDWTQSPVAHLFSAYRHLLALVHARPPSGATRNTASPGTSLPSILQTSNERELEAIEHGLVPGLVGQHRNILRRSTSDASTTSLEKVEARELATRALLLLGDEMGVPAI